MPSAIWKLNPTEIIFLRLIWNDQSTTEHLKNKTEEKKLFKAKERNIISEQTSEQTWRFIVKNF